MPVGPPAPTTSWGSRSRRSSCSSTCRSSWDRRGPSMADAGSELPQFPTLGRDPEALERQLLVFTQDITEIYKRERARAEELEVALAELKTAYLETIRSLAFV